MRIRIPLFLESPDGVKGWRYNPSFSAEPRPNPRVRIYAQICVWVVRGSMRNAYRGGDYGWVRMDSGYGNVRSAALGGCHWPEGVRLSNSPASAYATKSSSTHQRQL